jgi:hypothetical protein
MIRPRLIRPFFPLVAGAALLCATVPAQSHVPPASPPARSTMQAHTSSTPSACGAKCTKTPIILRRKVSRTNPTTGRVNRQFPSCRARTAARKYIIRNSAWRPLVRAFVR